MTEEKKAEGCSCGCGCGSECKCDCCKPARKHYKHGGMGGGVYCLGFIGAAIYFIQHATTFWLGALGVLKAIAWPAFLIYKALEHLKF